MLNLILNYYLLTLDTQSFYVYVEYKKRWKKNSPTKFK